MTTAADHLRAQSDRLGYLLDNTPISGDAVHAVQAARHIIDIVASDLTCEKVRIVEPAPLPRRPWAAYAVAALACYLAGALTALAIVGAL